MWKHPTHEKHQLFPLESPRTKVFPERVSFAAAHGVYMCVTFSQVPSYKMEFRTPLALKTL